MEHSSRRLLSSAYNYWRLHRDLRATSPHILIRHRIIYWSPSLTAVTQFPSIRGASGRLLGEHFFRNKHFNTSPAMLFALLANKDSFVKLKSTTLSILNVGYMVLTLAITSNHVSLSHFHPFYPCPSTFVRHLHQILFHYKLHHE